MVRRVIARAFTPVAIPSGKGGAKTFPLGWKVSPQATDEGLAIKE